MSEQFAETSAVLRWFQDRIDRLEQAHHELAQALMDTQAALREALQNDGDGA